MNLFRRATARKGRDRPGNPNPFKRALLTVGKALSGLAAVSSLACAPDVGEEIEKFCKKHPEKAFCQDSTMSDQLKEFCDANPDTNLCSDPNAALEGLAAICKDTPTFPLCGSTPPRTGDDETEEENLFTKFCADYPKSELCTGPQESPPIESPDAAAAPDTKESEPAEEVCHSILKDQTNVEGTFTGTTCGSPHVEMLSGTPISVATHTIYTQENIVTEEHVLGSETIQGLLLDGADFGFFMPFEASPSELPPVYVTRHIEFGYPSTTLVATWSADGSCDKTIKSAIVDVSFDPSSEEMKFQVQSGGSPQGPAVSLEPGHYNVLNLLLPNGDTVDFLFFHIGKGRAAVAAMSDYCEMEGLKKIPSLSPIYPNQFPASEQGLELPGGLFGFFVHSGKSPDEKPRFLTFGRGVIPANVLTISPGVCLLTEDACEQFYPVRL